MNRISASALALTTALLAGHASAQTADGGGVGVTSGPINPNPLPPSFFGPFHTNMPMLPGPGPADNGPVLPGGPVAGGGVSAPGAAGAGVPARRWGFAGGGVGATSQPAPAQPLTTAAPGAGSARTAPSVMFRRFGR